MKTVFDVVKEGINSTGIGGVTNFRSLVRLANNHSLYKRGYMSYNRGTVYNYIRVLKKLKYVEKLNSHDIKVLKPIDNNIRYKDLVKTLKTV